MSIIHEKHIRTNERKNTCSFEHTHFEPLFFFTFIWDLFYSKQKISIHSSVVYSVCKTKTKKKTKQNGKYLENKTVYISWEKVYSLNSIKPTRHTYYTHQKEWHYIQHSPQLGLCLNNNCFSILKRKSQASKQANKCKINENI